MAVPRNRGGFRLPPCQVLLTGLIVGAGLGGLSGLLTGGIGEDGFIPFAVAGALIGVLAGSVIGLISSAVGLGVAAIYNAVSGRSRQGLISYAALGVALATVTLLLATVGPLWEGLSPWWFVSHGVVVFGITVFQAHLLVTASRPRSRVRQQHVSAQA